MKKYGDLPVVVDTLEVSCKEMMFYQYLPVKLINTTDIVLEPRLEVFKDLIGRISCDFVGECGLDRFVKSYIYLTAKRGWQKPYCSYNREGWHSDGFLTDDINYIWSDAFPTVFNNSNFELTLDDKTSIYEMHSQALKHKDVCYPDNSILRLDQYNIHRVADIEVGGMRTFVKLSFSEDKYDLEGNSINYMLDYKWDYKKRGVERNIPQSILK